MWEGPNKPHISPTLTETTTRLQSVLGFTSAAKRIWYILRGMDQKGSGRLECAIEVILSLCKRKISTVYQWLREAKVAGRIRDWQCRHGVLTVYYSSRVNVCRREKVRDWGTSADVPLLDAAQYMRKICTQLEVQSLQERSHFAAKRALRGNRRRYLKVYRPDELLELGGGIGAMSSITSCKASTPGIIHYGLSKIFVSDRFVPFGGSQGTTAEALQCCVRTVQRHLADIPRRQLVQTDRVYSLAAALIKHEGTFAKSTAGEVYTATGDRLIVKSSSSGAHSQPGSYEAVNRQQLFDYRGKSWRFRCNIYALDRRLTTTKWAKQRISKAYAQSPPRGDLRRGEQR